MAGVGEGGGPEDEDAVLLGALALAPDEGAWSDGCFIVWVRWVGTEYDSHLDDGGLDFSEYIVRYWLREIDSCHFSRECRMELGDLQLLLMRHCRQLTCAVPLLSAESRLDGPWL